MPRRDSCSRSRRRITVSSAHQEIERRLARSPRALAEELARVYGREFTQPNYIAAMALISRLRLGERDEVARLLAPYLDGTKDSFARPSQSSLAAHLLFFEYARRAGDDRAKALVLRAAASGFTENGELREFMPLHGGWSDSLFMDVPILAMAGALTGERRYFDMAARHVAFMQQIVLRPDGLYRHQASADAAWGRGNAFPALGLALTLSEFPQRACGLSPSAGVVPHAHGGARALPGRERDVAQRHRSAGRLSGILRHRDDCDGDAARHPQRVDRSRRRTSRWSRRRGRPSSREPARRAGWWTSAKAPARAA